MFRILTAGAVLLVGVVMVVLGVAAAADVSWDPAAATMVALMAIWIPQTLLYAMWRRRSR